MTATEYPFSALQSNDLPLDVEDSPTNYVQKILSERNEFQNQNVQLWNIIQKQRVIIQHQQKILSGLGSGNKASPQISDAEINIKVSDLESSKLNALRDSIPFNPCQDKTQAIDFNNKNQYCLDARKNETLGMRNTSLYEFQNSFIGSKSYKPKADVVLEYFSDSLEKREMNLNYLKELTVSRSDKSKHTRSKSEGEKLFSKSQPLSISMVLKHNTILAQPIESKLVEYSIIRNGTVMQKVSVSPKQSSALKLDESESGDQAINTNSNEFEERTRVIKPSTVQTLEPEHTKAAFVAKIDGFQTGFQNDKQELVMVEKGSSVSSCQDIATTGKDTLNDIDAPEVNAIEETITKESRDFESSIPEIAQLEPPVSNIELNTLENIYLLVSGITPKSNLKGKEVLGFRIQVNKLIKSNNQEAENSNGLTESILSLWIIEKTLSDISELDNKLRSSGQLSKNTANKFLDKKAWNTISPSKLDQRKLLLQNYLQDIIDTNLSVPSIIYDFLVSDRVAEIPLETPFGQKEGYLIKRGKNFGKWKKRYFIIKQSVLEYYDSKNGTKLGEIQLSHVQVAVQHTSSSEYETDGSSVDTFRHAFMILEPKKSTSVMCRHVLCADSDIERDNWVTAIGFHFKEDVSSEQYPTSGIELVTSTSLESTLTPVSKQNTTDNIYSGPTHPGALDVLAGVSYEHETVLDSNSHQCNLDGTTVPGTAPGTKSNDLCLKSTINSNYKPNNTVNTSLRVAVSKGGNKDNEYSKPIRQTILWGKKMLKGEFGKNKVPQLPVFGVTLQQSVMASRINEDSTLSSVVYRCIQYLDSKGAQYEEGIYRLSGSSATIRQLKTRFDTEGDYNILDSRICYDIHAISGLLKLYIRELPTSVLTPEKQNDFLRLTEYTVRRDRVRELGKLLSSLPIENYTLLRVLINHLISVVDLSDINKMTLKNVGIVFAPTLGIPAGVFGLLMSEFKYIFFINDDGSAAPQEVPEDEETVKLNFSSDSHLDSSQDNFDENFKPKDQPSITTNGNFNPSSEKILNIQQKEVSCVSDPSNSKPQHSSHFISHSEGTKRKHVRKSCNFLNQSSFEVISIEKKNQIVLPAIEDAVNKEVLIDSVL